MAGSCAGPGEPVLTESPESEGISLAETRELIRAYNREVLSSTKVFGRPSVLEVLREEQPTFQLLELFDAGDPAIERLGGAFWGIVCKEVGMEPFVNPLIRRLEDRDPRNRAFACEALGEMGWPDDSPARRAVPVLITMLEDDEPVPGYSGPPTVAVFAASALTYMKRSAGVDVLLASAENNEHWHASYGHHFRSLSGKDFGKDLEAWKAWVAENDGQGYFGVSKAHDFPKE